MTRWSAERGQGAWRRRGEMRTVVVGRYREHGKSADLCIKRRHLARRLEAGARSAYHLVGRPTGRVREKVSPNARLARYVCVRTGGVRGIDLDSGPVRAPSAVGFSEEDLVWWSEGERLEAMEQGDVEAAAPWENSGSGRAAGNGRVRRAASRVARRWRFVGVACAGLLLVGALLANAGLSGDAHQAPLSTRVAADQVASMPSRASRSGAPTAPAADAMPAEIAARPAAPARHRARTKSKKAPAPTVAGHAAGSKARPARKHPQ